MHIPVDGSRDALSGHVLLFLFSLTYAPCVFFLRRVEGGGGCAARVFFVLVSLFSRPRAGLLAPDSAKAEGSSIVDETGEC